MEIIHVSPFINHESIILNGLQPSIISLEQHLKVFHKDKTIKGEKAVYGWFSCDKNDKFIRDMVFCKVWINPRNRLADIDQSIEYYDDNGEYNFEPYIKKNLYHTDSMIFNVYKFDIEKERHTEYFHTQVDNENKGNTCFGLPDKYSHDDKKLYVVDEIVKSPILIGQAEWNYNKGENHIKILG